MRARQQLLRRLLPAPVAVAVGDTQCTGVVGDGAGLCSVIWVSGWCPVFQLHRPPRSSSRSALLISVEGAQKKLSVVCDSPRTTEAVGAWLAREAELGRA